MDFISTHLIKHDAVDLENGNILYILSYHAKGLIDRCSLKVDSRENWMNLIENMAKTDPAETFTLQDLNFAGKDNCSFKYTKGMTLTRMNAKKLLNLKFSEKKLRKPEEFVNEEFYLMGNVTKPYLRIYNNGTMDFDILSLLEIPVGIWFSADREKCNGKHKKPRVIM